jgi:ferric-dicitrate binding protein FerR (iron transport regulator)
MNDDLERQLDEFYRKLDPSARRVEARWRLRPATRRMAGDGSRAVAAGLGAGVAAAAAILLIVLALRSEQKPPLEPVVKAPPPVEPAPRTIPPPAPPPPVAPKPAPVEPRRPDETPRPQEPRPETPAVAEPKTPPPAPPAPRPEIPKREEPAGTIVARASAVLREIDGTFELADKGGRGKQKELTVFAGDRLRASTPVKITLADDRFVLLAPRSVMEFRPEEKRLTLSLEQGELLADLIGPGQDLRVVTKACEITPLGTVFGVKVDPGRVMVTVEKGRVDVQSAKGRASLRAAESIQASEDGSLGASGPADFRSLSWARKHRTPELALFAEDFSKPGAWIAEVDKGVARAVAKPGSGPVLHLATEKPIFEVPVRGSITVLCRTDRAGKIKIQVFCPEQRTTYTRTEIPVLRGDLWRAVTIDFDEFVPSDKSRPSRMPPGSPVTDLLIMYGEEGERGNFWVDSIKVTEVRP